MHIDKILFRRNFSDCRYRVVESASLVSALFREAFSHPNISFTSKCFSVSSFHTYIEEPISSIYWWVVLVDGEEFQ